MASTALAVRDGTVALQVFGDDYAAIKTGIAPNLTDTELDYLASVARSMGLSVLRKQIYGTKRKSKDSNGNWTESLTIQVGIDGYRVIADRTGKYAGQVGPYWCGPDGDWRDVWLSKEAPAAAKVGVLRKDFKEPLWAVAVYDSYVARNKDGSPSNLWHKMPELMLAKCAESLALRKAFPDEMGGTYTDDEMEQADNAPAVSEPPRTIGPASTPIEQPRSAPLSAARAKATPNGREQAALKLIADAEAKGVTLDAEDTPGMWADDIDAALEAAGSTHRVPRDEQGSPLQGALSKALLALPRREIDAETGEVREEDAGE